MVPSDLRRTRPKVPKIAPEGIHAPARDVTMARAAGYPRVTNSERSRTNGEAPHSKTWACDPANVGVARSWLTQRGAGRGTARVHAAAVGDAELVVSELVTNAMRAGCASVTVHL